jgi:spore germination cell wall hydrolase CwlJ-like protein
MYDLFTPEEEPVKEDGPLKKALLRIIIKRRYLPDHEAKTKSTAELQRIITLIESQKQKIKQNEKT